jgi:methylornithine synthase
LDFEAIFNAAGAGRPLPLSTARRLLTINQPDEIEALSQAARQARKFWFGFKVFFYGFVYFSTFCRNSCRFCLYRLENSAGPRYRLALNQILDAAGALADSGVHLIDLTSGEDQFFWADQTEGFVEIVGQVKKETGLSIMVSPGVIAKSSLVRLAAAGADWYACYQETHNPDLFAWLRPGQNFEARLMAKIEARRSGFLIEEGLLAGVGETAEDIADSLETMNRLDADQVRVMSLVPQPGTPMRKWGRPDEHRELLTIALMRLSFPDRLIPASLDVDGLKGLQARLDAGANVITSIIPPQKGLAGVSQCRLDIENAGRTVSALTPALIQSGLEPAPLCDYLQWMQNRKRRLPGSLESSPIEGLRKQ